MSNRSRSSIPVLLGGLLFLSQATAGDLGNAAGAAAGIYSNVAHVVTYYTRVVGRNGYRGNDIDAFEQAGGNPHVLAAGMLAYSAWALHRMKQRHIPVMFVQLRL